MGMEMVSGRPNNFPPLQLYLFKMRAILNLNPCVLVFAEDLGESSLLNYNQCVDPTEGL